MNEQRQYGPRDERSLPDGDTFFTGVDERLGPTQLAPGMVSRAKNMRFRKGKAETRPGLMICPWAMNDGRTPWNEVYGGAVFSDPNQASDWILIAADGGVWKTRPNMAASPVPLPAGVVLTADTFYQFVACMEVLILMRGDDQPPLVCLDLDEGFKAIVQTSDGVLAGLSPIPNSKFGIFYLNRLILINGRDLIAVSDIQDYTSYLALQGTFRINQGESQELVGMYPLDKSTIIMLKDLSVLRIDAANGDFGNAVLNNVTTEYGCIAPRSPVLVGSDLYWLSEVGVVNLRLTEQNEVQGTQLRLSDPLEETWRRVNPAYVKGAVSANWDGKLYMAVPLDDAEFLGGEQVPAGTVYGPLFGHSMNLPQGETFRYTQGVNGGYLINGSETVVGDTTFVCQNGAVTFFPIAGTPEGTASTVSLKQVRYTGINNGVLVYDFVAGAWAGVDEGDGVFCVKQFLRVKYNGVRRLFILGNDGVIRLYEEGFEDDVLAPAANYIDVLVNSLPAPGDTLQIDGDSPFTAANSPTNAANVWGCSTLALARSNLQLAVSQGNLDLRTAVAVPIDYGLRFTAQVGFGIVVRVTGNWAFVDTHGGANEVTSIPIQSTVRTRGYLCIDPDQKRYLAAVAIVQTWSPTFDVNTVTDGVSEVVNYYPALTRSNLTYDILNKDDWNPSNANDDHGSERRQDYSVVLPDLGFNLGSGVAFDLMQSSVVRVPINERGYYLQIEFVNTLGRFEVINLLMEAQTGDRTGGIHA